MNIIQFIKKYEIVIGIISILIFAYYLGLFGLLLKLYFDWITAKSGSDNKCIEIFYKNENYWLLFKCRRDKALMLLLNKYINLEYSIIKFKYYKKKIFNISKSLYNEFRVRNDNVHYGFILSELDNNFVLAGMKGIIESYNYPIMKQIYNN